MAIGKDVRLQRLLGNAKAVWVPVDDALISGPVGGLEVPDEKITAICQGRPTAMLAFRYAVQRILSTDFKIPTVLNLTASTTQSEHTRKVLVASVTDAIRLGCDGVAVHVNVGSRHEGVMLGQLGRVITDAAQLDIPVLALMYARSEHPDGSDDNHDLLKRDDPTAYSQLIAHAVRVGIEMGADIIKTQYTGSPETFAAVIRAAGSVPVLIAGGSYLSDWSACMDLARNAIIAGARGVCFGRNLFGRETPAAAIQELSLALNQVNATMD